MPVPPPLLDATLLSEAWEPPAIRSALSPLVDAYKQWIARQRAVLSTLPEDQRRIAEPLVQRCETVAQRMGRSLDLLAENEEVRLAFCFAMKAMALQAAWPSGKPRKPLSWHPFQLAFILLALESVSSRRSEDREVCDLLWVPTGAGKTEAYLALAAFAIAYRRLCNEDRRSAGVTVLSRYTLRLLTIQQFRRTLKLVTACEFLRVSKAGAASFGWRPSGCRSVAKYLWGTVKFTCGLWVGGGVTPNSLTDTWGGDHNVLGALSILRREAGVAPANGFHEDAPGEPAQVVRCPACNSWLAIPGEKEGGAQDSELTVHLVVRADLQVPPPNGTLATDDVMVKEARTTRGPRGFTVLSLKLVASERFTAELIDGWWRQSRARVGAALDCARASRPGYFLRWYAGPRGGDRAYDFEIFCANPDCALKTAWFEATPHGSFAESEPNPGRLSRRADGLPELDHGMSFSEILSPFQSSKYVSVRIPIPAYTVDDQIYHRCPTVVIATVDKFARPAFEPRASALFGNVDHYHSIWGYYRAPLHGDPTGQGDHPGPAGRAGSENFIAVQALRPPDLVIQDELHLIEGPLGSMVGMYETAVDLLCRDGRERPAKLIASSATVRRAGQQVAAVFQRATCSFPPPGLSVGERFFLRYRETPPTNGAGRLYVGVCAPGRGPLTPLVRMWARLLQVVFENRQSAEWEKYWTLVGYFNAVRELAGARALYRQDIPERVQKIGGGSPRPLEDEKGVELSRRTGSVELPVLLESLSQPGRHDALFTTSMFGTGVDIPHLSLMLVHGQPKSTSSYIQATGRVGRSSPGLVLTFLRATRPRDLNHYEFFAGYHRQLHRFVEPVTVMPFSSGALHRAAGPVGVFILRNSQTAMAWHRNDGARSMSANRGSVPVQALASFLEARAAGQPQERRPPRDMARQISESGLDRWFQVAQLRGGQLVFVEYAISQLAQQHVVLGDEQHQQAGLDVVYPNAPTSLRDVEPTLGFQA